MYFGANGRNAQAAQAGCAMFSCAKMTAMTMGAAASIFLLRIILPAHGTDRSGSSSFAHGAA